MYISRQMPRCAVTAWRKFSAVIRAPVSIKNLRLSALMIAVHQMVIAHIVLLFVVLALTHVQHMREMLDADTQEEIENGFSDDSSPSQNEERLHNASNLMHVIETAIHVLTGTAAVYLVCIIALVVGVYKSQPKLMIPWLVVEVVGIVGSTVLFYWLQEQKFVEMIGGKLFYFLLVGTLIAFHAIMWYIIHAYYCHCQALQKLCEGVVAPIPCGPPEPSPETQANENSVYLDIVQAHVHSGNIHVGSNGYQHTLTDAVPTQDPSNMA